MDAIASAMSRMVSVSDFNKGNAGTIFTDVKKSGKSKLVMRRNEPECVLISPKTYSDIMQELEDLRDYRLAVERLTANASDSGRSFTEVLAEEGLSIEDIGSSEEVEFE